MQSLNVQFTQTFFQSILSSIDSKDPVAATAWLETLLDVVDLLPVEVLQTEVIDIARSKSQRFQPVLCRISTCQLIGKLSRRLIAPIVQAELLPLAESLSQDDDPAVRAAICNQLIFLMKGLLSKPDSTCNNVLIQMLVDATNDSALEVKLAAIDCLSSASGITDEGTCTAVIVPLLRTLCKKSLEQQDWSLPVIATHLGNFCKNLQASVSNDTKDWLLDYYVTLSLMGLNKPADKNNTMPDLLPLEKESCVVSSAEMFFDCRIACAVNLPLMANFATWNKSGQMATHRSIVLLDVIESLSTDPYPQVRKHVATALLKVSKCLGNLSNRLYIVWIRLLQDSNYDVICTLVSDIGPTLDHFCRLGPNSPFGSENSAIPETCQALLLCEQQLASTRNWRSHAEFWAHVALLPLYQSYPSVHDTFVPVIFERIHNSRPLPVRLSATHTLVWFLRTETREDCRQACCQRIVSELAQGNNYHSRMLFLKMCDMLLDVVSRTFFKLYFWDAVLALSRDKVPNVRLRFCGLLPIIRKVACDDLTLKELDVVIRDLVSKEQDRDVKFQLQKSMKASSMDIPASQANEEIEEDRRREIEENAMTKSKTSTHATEALQPLLFIRNDSGSKDLSTKNTSSTHSRPATDEFLVDAGVPLSSTSISHSSVISSNSRIPTPFASKMPKPPKPQACLRTPQVQSHVSHLESKLGHAHENVTEPKSVRSRMSTGFMREATVKRSLISSAAKSKSQEHLDAPLRPKINAHAPPRPVSVSLTSPVSSRSSSPVRELKKPTKLNSQVWRSASRPEIPVDSHSQKNSNLPPAFLRNQFRASTGSRPPQMPLQSRAVTPFANRKLASLPAQPPSVQAVVKNETPPKIDLVNSLSVTNVAPNPPSVENSLFLRQSAWRKSAGGLGNTHLPQPKLTATPKVQNKLFPEVPSINNNVCKIPLPCTKNLIKS